MSINNNKWIPKDGIIISTNKIKLKNNLKNENNIFSTWFSSCFKRQKISHEKNIKLRGKTRSRSCSVNKKEFEGAFCEHIWDLKQLSLFFRDSRIDIKQPQKSLGLTWEFAKSQLLLKGRNILPKPKEMSKWELLLKQFWNLLWVLLIGASCLSLLQFFLDTSELINLWITLILFGMIFVMCFVSWFQEMRARQVVRGFQKLLPQCSQVIREGKEISISAPDLVVGDLVHIRTASSITGESEPVEYQSEEVSEQISVFEARNVAFNGSLCVEGEGFGIVIRVGENTVIGQTAKLTTGQEENVSRLEEQIKKYVKFLIIMACSVALIIFIVGGFVHHWTDVTHLLANGFLVCAIGMVPCGLPATVTSILTLLARRLANRNVYVKRLDICEALGQVSIIASDKTGTLTKNEMTVTGLWNYEGFINGYPQSEHQLTLNSFTSDGISLTPSIIAPPWTLRSIGGNRFPHPISDILTCMTVCNTAILNLEEGEEEIKKKEQHRKVSRADSLKAVLWAQSSLRGEPKKHFNVSTINEENEFPQNSSDKIEKGLENSFQKKLRPIAKRSSNIQKPTAIGTPSEVAMLNYAANLINVHKCRQEYEDVAFEIPFNSKRKWHLKIIRMGVQGEEAEYKLFIKGASEVLAKMCSKILTKNGLQQFGLNNGIEKLESAYTEFANGGHRVIGFAQTNFRAPIDIEFNLEIGNVPLNNLIFLGVCAIMDPPREQTKEAINSCKTAGIKVFMVTGDHQLTACAIAKQIGLINENKENISNINNNNNEDNLLKSSLEFNLKTDWAVVQGQQISRLTAQQWDQLILKKNSVVFARTTPEQKLLIVEQCQKRNQIIAMTGDGVNDAPALKKSEIGIAMGSGSEVAKQAADIDDNFSSIVQAVKEGRTMYENIKKLLAYTMPHSFPEVWPIIINFCFGMPVGITALQILSIDLGTEIFPGISLANEKPEGDVMARPPRALNKVLISNGLLAYSYIYTGQIQSLGCFLAYCYVFWCKGINIFDLPGSALNCWKKGGDIFRSNGLEFSVEEQLLIGRQATSAWQMGIVFGQFFNIWSARTRRISLFKHGICSNKALIKALLIELILINLYVYLPGLNEFLGGAAIPWQCWVVVAAVGIFINIYNEIRKYFIRHYPKNKIVYII
ncbi:Cation_ATPase_N domain-containing protein [Meloidogyne graminicola]|uniref:Cation_ATPase_N domain-containing protein n=1 Tax=Meloidogyne graminicola TaxID=189291 RepID=A0A8S9ZG82_9BILA|nr:Cation_ATPase_N domain-containing protein [Meloidogyne graminicola]